MSFRRKLLGVFVITVVLSVTLVAFLISYLARRTFERADDARTTALVAQFHREFDRRGQEVVRVIETAVASEPVTRLSLTINHGITDYSATLNDAKTLADSQQLDFLELTDDQGTIISSAQWPAKFGYKEALVPPPSAVPVAAFLKMEETPDGSGLGLFAIRRSNVGDKPLYVIGGRRLDKEFLASIELPTGMRTMFYQNLGSGFSPQLLVDPSGTVQSPEKLAPLIQQVQQQRAEATSLIHWTASADDDEIVHAIPLAGLDNQLLGVLLVGNSRRNYVELGRHIGSAALLAMAAGFVLAVVFSSWTAARVTRPVVQLAEAAREVASGNWSVQAPVTSSDELGQLAESFNQMTHELLEQKAAWYRPSEWRRGEELARRLAHELKNPMFPLQLTVENLLRAHQQSPAQFEEIFKESASTLLAEISNLKAIVGRFSEFSKMPQPQWQKLDVNEAVRAVARLFQAQLTAKPGSGGSTSKLELGEAMPSIAADPDLLHRALSNLILNAMDAMPNGGTLTVRTSQSDQGVRIEIADSGQGLTPENASGCSRPTTPAKPMGQDSAWRSCNRS